MWGDAALVAVEITLGTGIISSAWLLVRAGQLKHVLLNRQLFHQATAKFAFFCVAEGLKVVGALTSQPTDCLGDPEFPHLTAVKSFTLRGLTFASWTAEVHIAAGIAASAFHHRTAQLALERTILWIWITALVVNVGVLVELGFVEEKDSFDFDPIGSIFLCVCLLVVFVLYLAAVIGVRQSHAPEVALQRTQRRALVYPTIFILTSLPSILRSFKLLGSCSDVALWSAVVEDSCTMLTALAYWILNPANVRRRPNQRNSVQMGGRPPQTEHSVGFTADVSVEDISYGSWRMGFQYSENAREGREFRLTIDKRRHPDKELGIHIEDGTAIVSSVSSYGLIADWNSERPGREVRRGDVLLEVNGQKAATLSTDALAAMEVLDMLMFRDRIDEEIFDADDVERSGFSLSS